MQAHTGVSSLQPPSLSWVSHAQERPHYWEGPLTPHPDTLHCRANLAIFLSLRGPGLLRTGQSSAHPCRARLACHMRPVDSELQGRSLLCSVATGVGLLSYGSASASPLGPRAGKGHPPDGITAEPSSPASCSQPAWPCPSWGGHHFYSCLFLDTLFFTIHLGVVPDGWAGRPPWVGSVEGSPARPPTLPRRCLKCLSSLFLLAPQPCLAEDENSMTLSFSLGAGQTESASPNS